MSLLSEKKKGTVTAFFMQNTPEPIGADLSCTSRLQPEGTTKHAYTHKSSPTLFAQPTRIVPFDHERVEYSVIFHA